MKTFNKKIIQIQKHKAALLAEVVATRRTSHDLQLVYVDQGMYIACDGQTMVVMKADLDAFDGEFYEIDKAGYLVNVDADGLKYPIWQSVIRDFDLLEQFECAGDMIIDNMRQEYSKLAKLIGGYAKIEDKPIIVRYTRNGPDSKTLSPVLFDCDEMLVLITPIKTRAIIERKWSLNEFLEHCKTLRQLELNKLVGQQEDENFDKETGEVINEFEG